MRKNGCVTVGDTEMYYVAFGDGKRNLVVLPGAFRRINSSKRESVAACRAI